MPVFEQRVDNIVGIAYAMDLLDYVTKVSQLVATFICSLKILVLHFSNYKHKSHSLQNYDFLF